MNPTIEQLLRLVALLADGVSVHHCQRLFLTYPFPTINLTPKTGQLYQKTAHPTI
jgi:hypothetical protein